MLKMDKMVEIAANTNYIFLQKDKDENATEIFRHSCNNTELETIGGNTSRISCCSYKSNDIWDMLMHKKEAHSLPNIPPKDKGFLVKRTREISSILGQGFDPAKTKVVFIECKCQFVILIQSSE
jgi:hypothetical protein